MKNARTVNPAKKLRLFSNTLRNTYLSRRVMLVVSKPKSVCHYGNPASRPRPVITCFGLHLGALFSIPTRQVSKPQRPHMHHSDTPGAMEFSSNETSGELRIKPGESPQFSITTAASETHLSPRHSIIEEHLPELSPGRQLSHDICLSGTLFETLQSVASAHVK